MPPQEMKQYELRKLNRSQSDTNSRFLDLCSQSFDQCARLSHTGSQPARFPRWL